jgi:hypothetical protein
MSSKLKNKNWHFNEFSKNIIFGIPRKDPSPTVCYGLAY